MQLSLRASLASLAVRRAAGLGFDRARARELQWLFTNAHIAPRVDEHVLDSFQGFLAALGTASAARSNGICRCRRRRAQYAAGADPGCAADADHQSLLEPRGAQLARRTLRGHHRPRRRGATACG